MKQIDNPKNTKTYRYAGFGVRLLASFTDYIILFFISISISSILGTDPFVLEATTFLESFDKVFTWIIIILYDLFFWVNYDGATPGKRFLGIKIIKTDESKLNYAIAFVRWLGELVSGFVLCLGYIWIIFDKKKQGWHDKIAGTYVIKTGKKSKIFLAVVFLLIGLMMFFYQVYRHVEVKNKKADPELKKEAVERYLDQQLGKMNPEAKTHFDKSRELFGQMREASNDPEKVKQLNEENITELKKALDIDPNNANIWYELGSAYTWVSLTGTLEQGLIAYQNAERLEPENTVYIDGVGDMFLRMARYQEAVLQFQKTLRLTDKSGYANLGLGIAYKNLGINEDARKHFRKAIDIFTVENDHGQYDDEILRVKYEMASLLE